MFSEKIGNIQKINLGGLVVYQKKGLNKENSFLNIYNHFELIVGCNFSKNQNGRHIVH